jgi:hypothetical protein
MLAGNVVKCRVSDNGSAPEPVRRGRGLAIIGELANSLGGRVHTSCTAEGYYFLLTFPLTDAEQRAAEGDVPDCVELGAEVAARPSRYSGCRPVATLRASRRRSLMFLVRAKNGSYRKAEEEEAPGSRNVLLDPVCLCSKPNSTAACGRYSVCERRTPACAFHTASRIHLSERLSRANATAVRPSVHAATTANAVV